MRYFGMLVKTFLVLLIANLMGSASEIRVVECKSGCLQGPIRLPYWICQCPLTVNPEISSCIQKCVNDVICRFCYGDVHIGLPPVCPLVINQPIDLSGIQFDFVFDSGAKIFGLERGKGTDQIYFDPVTRFGRAVVIVDKLSIEGKYNIDGRLCENTSIESAGYLKILFENLVVDWYPQIDVIFKCNIPYFFINGPKSNMTLSTNKRVRFDFTQNSVSASTLSQCANAEWDKVIGKIIGPLQIFINQALSDFSNILLSQVPVYEVFKIGSVTPLTSLGLPQMELPLPQGGIPLPITIPGGVLPGGLPGGGLILGNLGLAPNNIFLNYQGNTTRATTPTRVTTTPKSILNNLLSIVKLPNLPLP